MEWSKGHQTEINPDQYDIKIKKKHRKLNMIDSN